MNRQAVKTKMSVPELWQQYARTRDPQARNELILEYSYLVKCIAIKIVGHYQYFNYLEDIVNEGLIALMDAILKFDPAKQVKFETYASIRIRGAMIDYIRKQDCFPRRLKKMAKAINDADEVLNQRLGRTPTDGEIADYLHVSSTEYEKMLAETCSMNMLSFEELVYEKGVENLALHLSEKEDSPEQAMAEKELLSELSRNIGVLDGKEQLVIGLYYKEQLKIKEISGVLGISESRVSQIHSNALRKLKRNLEEYLRQ
jgi:RNA polymerase sigma factor for flagellar operon FliA